MLAERILKLTRSSVDGLTLKSHADAYLADGQKDLARQHAEKTLALLDSHAAPASSWSDTAQRRSEIRTDAEQVLKKTAAAKQ